MSNVFRVNEANWPNVSIQTVVDPGFPDGMGGATQTGVTELYTSGRSTY